jgi:hypothetical protein
MMNEQNMTLNAFRRFFPNWDKMTDRERQAAMNDPNIQGTLAAQMDAQRMGSVEKRAAAERAERNRLRNTYSGPL